jgi:thioredoxin-related protein
MGTPDRRSLLAALAAFAAWPARAADPVPGDNGLYTQPWFLASFLDLREDQAEAAGKGKRLAILWEQRGCPYCKEFHSIVLAKPEIVEFFRRHFEVLQLDLHGSRKVKDFDGKEISEKEFAGRSGVRFTPTIQFFPAASVSAGARTAREFEQIRMPGYLKPFAFYAFLHYVQAGHSRPQEFEAYLKAMHADSVAKGGKAHLW